MILDPKATSATEIPWYQVLHQPDPAPVPVKTALLTGGSGGIGSATKRLLEARGWNVIAPTRAELDWSGDGVISVQDGNYDAMIFCHGEWYSFNYHTPSDWDYQYRMRVANPMYVIQDFLKRGKVKHVLMVSSTRGFIGGVNTAPYSAACAAQISLMAGYAREYAGVRFNAVCPGLTKSRMAEQVRATGGCKPDAIAQPPEFVAGVIVGLCEDGVSNGRVVRVVDGKAGDMKWMQVGIDFGNS